MNPQQANRLMSAVSHHGIAFVAYLDTYGICGDCPSAKHLYVGESYLTIGLDAFDAHGYRLDRRGAKRLATQLREEGVDVYMTHLAKIAIQQPVKRNEPVAMLSRWFNHRPSHLHSSKKTAKAKVATRNGYRADAERARLYNQTCSAPAMMSGGKNKDPKPVTLHTPRPTGLQGK